MLVAVFLSQCRSQYDKIKRIVQTYIILLFAGLKRGTKSNRSGSTVMLLGIMGAGKTTLYHQVRAFECMTPLSIMKYEPLGMQLKHGKFVPTVTSMKEKFDGAIELEDGTALTVLDYPGHPRLRLQVQDFYPLAKSIIFVIDAADKSAIRPSAEYLFDVFSHPKVHDAELDMLIWCNKMDTLSSSSKDRIQRGLEKEL